MMNQKLEDFLYKKVIRKIAYNSTLGKTSIEGDSDTGFNFDYMYRNEPSGNGRFGEIVDKILLNLPAVKATRNRKETIKKILREELKNNGNKQINILDVASGPARYLVEFANEKNVGFKALCLDNDKRSLEIGEELLRQYSVNNSITFKSANIFNDKELNLLSFNPDYIIASGIYVYHDDISVKKSVKIFSNLLDKGQKILVDNQIKNPSKKLMEKVCTTTQGKSWELHYRSEEHMISLLDPCFKIIHSDIDKWGMYNIIVAIKR